MSDALDNAIWQTFSNRTRISVPRPTCMMRMIYAGDLPVNAGLAQATTGECALMIGDNAVFRAVCSVQLQGQSSLADIKKGYKFTFTNESGDDLEIQVGSWVPTTKIDMKAYGTGPALSGYGNADRTMIRDTSAAQLWRNIRKHGVYPDNMIAPFQAWAYAGVTQGVAPTGALFSTEGFPCELIVNNKFFGLYTFRSRASNPDFLIDKKNSQHYLLQPQHMPDDGWYNLDTTNWDISSPKMKGYNSQDDISTTFPKVYKNINRLITWFAECKAGITDIKKTWSDYINLSSWIDYIIFCETVYSEDAFINNLNLVSWDATIWHVCAYDLDETFGISTGLTLETADPSVLGFATTLYGTGNGPFYIIFNEFQDEIKQRWAELRSANVISLFSLNNIFSQSINRMNPDSYAADVADWGTNNQSSLAYLMDWSDRRIAWLDEQWGYSAS